MPGRRSRPSVVRPSAYGAYRRGPGRNRGPFAPCFERRLLLLRAAAQHPLGLLAREPGPRRLAVLAEAAADVGDRIGQLLLPLQPVLRDRLGLDPHLRVAIPVHTGPGRDQLADDHVLLETEQWV